MKSRQRKIRQMKGLMKSLEAVIAILMMLTFFIYFFRGAEQLPEFETINWQLKGFNSLKTLDKNNQLRQYAIANDTQTIESQLASLLPAETSYKIIICNATCGNPGITSEKLTSVSYFIAGDLANFQPREIVLYMW
jgi:hypothetical protein